MLSPMQEVPMPNQARVIAFDIDKPSLSRLRKALPDSVVEELHGATAASLTHEWNPGAVDLLVVAADDHAELDAVDDVGLAVPAQARHGAIVQIAGNVICRQRPGTAKGFVFISLEDETGVSNAIVDPNLFERFRLLITEEAFLLIEGEVQNSDGVVLIKTCDIKPLPHEQLVGTDSHDFR